jgi:quinol monooxygenase YgiN
MEDGNLFVLIGEWQTQEALDRYIASDQFGILMAAADILCEQKEVEINQVGHTSGIEAIKRSRQKPG